MAKELSQDTKFSLSIQSMVSLGVGIATLVGFYYMMMGEIQEAKELPTLESLYESEYPSKPQGYNHPASYEQYKSQVGALQENQDEIEKLKQQVVNLRIAVQ